MIHLEQIQELETKINKAVDLIKVLKEENQALKRTIGSSQNRMQELEKMVAEFKGDQDEIERHILRALENLEHLEDEIIDTENKEEIENRSEEEQNKVEPAPQNKDLPFNDTEKENGDVRIKN